MDDLATRMRCAWAEFLRHEEIREAKDLAGIRRALWAIEVPRLPAARPRLAGDLLRGGPGSDRECRAEAARLQAEYLHRSFEPFRSEIQSGDKEAPVLRDVEGVRYRWGGDEHGILQFTNPSREIALGDKVLLLATHCDPTVNFYDHLFTFRGETVEALWPIAARGKSQ